MRKTVSGRAASVNLGDGVVKETDVLRLRSRIVGDGGAGMLVVQASEHVGEVKTPAEVFAQRLDGFADTFQDGAQLILRITQQAEEQLHGAVARATP